MRKMTLILALLTNNVLAEVPIEAIRTTDAENICFARTRDIRDVSESSKKAVYLRDGIPRGNHTGKCLGLLGCEVDHRIALWVGGSNSLKNLTIQPYFGDCDAHDKDRLEVKMHKMACEGSISVPNAQDILYNKWQEGYKTYIDSKGCKHDP